jgi:hypothetical protein
MSINANSTIVITDTYDAYFNNLTYRGQFQQLSPQQGFQYGYYNDWGPSSVRISRFAFTNSVSSGYVGDLSFSRKDLQQVGSRQFGYGLGGSNDTGPAPPFTRTQVDTIDRWPFASAITNASDVGNLSVARTYGGSAGSDTHGYFAGGDTNDTYPDPTWTASDTIDRFPFSLAITNAADVGNLTTAGGGAIGCSSSTYGYAKNPWAPLPTAINRWPFALSITNAAGVGTLTTERGGEMSCQSAEYGYFVSGVPDPWVSAETTIERFPFASGSVNTTDIGDATIGVWNGMCASSTNYGYVGIGGFPTYPSGYWQYSANRFPFASAIANGENVGDLTDENANMTGAAY